MPRPAWFWDREARIRENIEAGKAGWSNKKRKNPRQSHEKIVEKKWFQKWLICTNYLPNPIKIAVYINFHVSCFCGKFFFFLLI